MRYGVWWQPKNGTTNGQWVGGSSDWYTHKFEAEDEAAYKRKIFSETLFEVRECPKENDK
jgi:hypothetical protein